jgi:thiosulfate sulfurtransferase
MSFECIEPDQYRELLENEEVTLLDIRDPASFANGHIENSIHVEQIDVDTFVEEHPRDKPLVVCCYHGNSSQGAADFFSGKGFTRVYSLNGGYEGWPWKV